MILPDEYIKLYSNSSQATQISYILKKYTNSDDVILDANAGIGGNSFYFCKFYKFVYCVDISNNSIYFLEENLKNYENKFIINENVLDIFNIINTNIIFFDPPWGKNYKFNENLNLYLDNKNIIDIIEKLYIGNYIKIIALKAPINYKINYSKSLWKIKEHYIYKNCKYSVIFKLIIYYK